jgi:hypothetical protein
MRGLAASPCFPEGVFPEFHSTSVCCEIQVNFVQGNLHMTFASVTANHSIGTRASFTTAETGRLPVVCAAKGDVTREFIGYYCEGDKVMAEDVYEPRPSTAAVNSPWVVRFGVRGHLSSSLLSILPIPFGSANCSREPACKETGSGMRGLLDPDRTAPSTADEAARQFTEGQVSTCMRPIGPRCAYGDAAPRPSASWQGRDD